MALTGGNRRTVDKRQSILVLDNYDSFTFNLVHYLIELGANANVVRADAITAAGALSSGADAFLISPGPGRPERAGHSLDLVRACASAGKPLLGVCLGHQAIAAAFGASIVHAPRPLHGTTDEIEHDRTGLFHGLPSPFEATRYHSLVVNLESLDEVLTVNAWSRDGAVQGLRHRNLPIHGVQFHPESAATQWGHELMKNFLRIVALNSQ
jgi:anthranilate synthase component 2